MPPTSVALLTFNRNAPARTLELVHRLSDHIQEAVVVDSSDPGPWKELESGLRPPTSRALRVIPTGYADLLQPVGVDEIRSEWVFYCDPDEYPSPALLRRVADPKGADAFIIPRWEQTLGAYTPHLRLFRRDAFIAPDPAYAFPGIRGVVRKLPRTERLIHHREYRTALAEDYQTRVMDLESLERPIDAHWIRSAFAPLTHATTHERPSTRSTSSSPVSGALVALATASISVRELLRTGSPASTRFQWQYHRARARFQSKLTPAERQHRAEIVRDTRAGGGLIRYLGFDRPEYVRSLSASFTWDLDGLAVLHRLIDYRWERGVPMPSWTSATLTSSRPPPVR